MRMSFSYTIFIVFFTPDSDSGYSGDKERIFQRDLFERI